MTFRQSQRLCKHKCHIIDHLININHDAWQAFFLPYYILCVYVLIFCTCGFIPKTADQVLSLLNTPSITYNNVSFHKSKNISINSVHVCVVYM